MMYYFWIEDRRGGTVGVGSSPTSSPSNLSYNNDNDTHIHHNHSHNSYDGVVI